MPDTFGTMTLEELMMQAGLDGGPLPWDPAAMMPRGSVGGYPLQTPPVGPPDWRPGMGMGGDAGFEAMMPTEPVPQPAPQLPGPSAGMGGFGERFGMALAQRPLQYQSRGRGGFEDFFGNLLQSAGNTYGQNVARGVGEREQFNERQRIATADRNRTNIAESHRYRDKREARAEAARTLREARTEKARDAAEALRVAEETHQRRRGETLEDYETRRRIEARIPIGGGGAASSMTTDDAESIAQAIIRGDQPPTLTGLYRNAGPVRAALARHGYDLTRSGLDYEAFKRHIASRTERSSFASGRRPRTRAARWTLRAN